MSDSDLSVWDYGECNPWLAPTGRYTKNERQWCRAEGLKLNRPALAAFWVLHGDRSWNVFHMYSGSSLPDRSDSEGWDEMLQWRHPRVDLNLLQLAAVCDSRNSVAELQDTVLAREENYRDNNSRLVNHPVHLACRLGCHSALRGMTSISPKVFCEEGAVNLTAARVNRSPSTGGRIDLNTDNGLTSGATADSVNLSCISSDNELLALLMRNDPRGRDSAMTAAVGENQVTGTPLDLIGQGDFLCAPVLLEFLANKLLIALPRPQQVAVDSLRNTLGEVCRRGMPAPSFNTFVHSFANTVLDKVNTLRRLESEPYRSLGDTQGHARQLQKAREEIMWCREMLILACQLLWSLPKEDVSSTSSLEAVLTIFCSLIYDSASQSYERAASYLPQKHLNHMVEVFQREERTSQQQQKRKYPPLETAVQVLKEVARHRTLQDLCLLPILESVRGDARAARNLSALPEPLRKRFHVPFQEF